METTKKTKSTTSRTKPFKRANWFEVAPGEWINFDQVRFLRAGRISDTVAVDGIGNLQTVGLYEAFLKYLKTK